MLRDLYGDLARYTGRDPDLVRQRCKTALVELAWQWDAYKERPTDFYRETDLYLFDLTEYQMRLRTNGTHTWLRQTVRDHGWQRGLDFGGGIGEWALIAEDEGAKMAYHDLCPSKTWDYAAWRFGRHQAHIAMLQSYPLNERWPFVIAMDVLEHLPEPEPVLEQIARCTDWVFWNPYEIQYCYLTPMHISRYDPSPLFEHVEGYLWHRR